MAEVAHTTGKKENEPPVNKPKRVHRKKGDPNVVGKGNREVCEMAVKHCCGGQCWLPSQRSSNDGHQLISSATSVMFISTRLVIISITFIAVTGVFIRMRM